jgi:hypothetical protein
MMGENYFPFLRILSSSSCKVFFLTGPWSLWEPVLHIVRSSASSSSCHYLLFTWSHPIAFDIFFIVFPSLLSFLPSLLQQHVSEGSSYARFYKFIYPSSAVLYVKYYFPPRLCALPLHFLQDRASWSPSFSNTTFQTFKILSEVSRFWHSKKLCSKCSMSQVSSSGSVTILWRKNSSSCYTYAYIYIYTCFKGFRRVCAVTTSNYEHSWDLETATFQLRQLVRIYFLYLQ